MVTIRNREMYSSLNLGEVRHEQRRVAALLNASGQLDLPPFPHRNHLPIDQLFRNRYHQKFVSDGLDAKFSRQERREDFGARNENDKNVAPKQKRTLQEKAYDHLDKLNFPNKQNANKRNLVTVKKAAVTKKYDSENDRTNGKHPLMRPLGEQLQKNSESLRDALKISSREGARNVPYRLPRKTEITRNLEVAIARSRRNKQNVEGRNLKPLEIPTGQSNWNKSSPVVRLKLKHDDKGKGMDLGMRVSDEEAERTRPLLISPLKTPLLERLKSGSSGRGSSGQTTSLEDSPFPSPTSSRASSGIGTYRTENEEEEAEPEKVEDSLSREPTQDTLWFQRHGYTKSAWLRKRMRDEAAKRRKDASVGTDEPKDTAAEKPLPGLRKAKRMPSDVYANTNMDAYRQAYIKALAVARSRALPKEPWMLGTRTSRAFTFSYFTHVATCRCGQCPQKAKEAKSKKSEMKMIFGDVKMMDYYKPPKVIKSKRQFRRRTKDVQETLMTSLQEEDEEKSMATLKLPKINGNDDNEVGDRDDDDFERDENSEEQFDNYDNPDTDFQGDNASLQDSLLSDDTNTLVSMATKHVSFKKPDVETSGYDSDSSVEM
ncbi:uncharacterized protein LOC144447412 [Glandiceps talaboti]